MIDFGLAYMSTLWEDKAVDLYVLERAFSSTHPGSDGIFEAILRAYEKGLGKAWKEIGRKLEEGASPSAGRLPLLVRRAPRWRRLFTAPDRHADHLLPPTLLLVRRPPAVRLRGRKRSMIG